MLCQCDCHIIGSQIMHIMACCDRTYQEYLNSDGTFNEEAYNKIRAKEIFKDKPKRKDKRRNQ